MNPTLHQSHQTPPSSCFRNQGHQAGPPSPLLIWVSIGLWTPIGGRLVLKSLKKISHCKVHPFTSCRQQDWRFWKPRHTRLASHHVFPLVSVTATTSRRRRDARFRLHGKPKEVIDDQNQTKDLPLQSVPPEGRGALRYP